MSPTDSPVKIAEVPDAPLRPADVPDAPLKSGAEEPPSSRYPLVALLLLGFFGLIALALASGEAHRKHLLHAVPESELVITPELAPPATLAQQELFAALFKTEAVYGAPPSKLSSKLLELPSDFRPQPGVAALALSQATAASPPPPHPPSPHPPPSPKPWLVEAATPPRPINASLAVAASTPGRWAYGVRDVRPGTVLLAQRPFGRESSYFDGMAVLLLKVCGCHPSIFGVILSAPSEQKMASAFCPLSKAAYPDFANSSIRLGGPVGPHWTLLHGRSDVDAIEVSPGIYMGGSLERFQRLVSDGRASPSEVLFYTGYSAWPIERLKEEVAAGQWRVAKASSSLLLDAAKRGGSASEILGLALA